MQRTMKQYVWFSVIVYVYGLLSKGAGEKILGQETDEFDFDGLPGAQHEFKVEVGAGKEECFFQKVVAGGKMHISFEVLKGGDTMIQMLLLKPDHNILIDSGQTSRAGFEPDIPETGIIVIVLIGVLKGTDLVVDGTIRSPDMNVIFDTYGGPRGSFKVPIEEEGPYAICLDNTFSRMSPKLVYVYLVTYVESEWEKYQKEIEDLSLTVTNFSTSIHQVEKSLKDASMHQAQSRMHVIKDWYLISGNNKYIQRWSLAQCCVIIISTCIQVYFVRRLFRTVNVTPTSKPRA